MSYARRAWRSPVATLQMLEELGHVTVVETEARRAHAITDAGRRDLELNQEAVRDFYERFEDEPWEVHAEDFGDAVRRMSRLFRREFRPGARRGRLTPQVMARIRAAIDDAFVKIQQALNGEDQNPERMGVCFRRGRVFTAERTPVRGLMAFAGSTPARVTLPRRHGPC